MVIPIGYRFSPSKVEIITILASFNNGESLPIIEVHNGYNVFGNLTPSDLFLASASDTYNSDDSVGRYFYTPLKRLTKNGKNVKRTVEKTNDQTGNLECVGTWKGVTAPDYIFDPQTKALIGESRSYRFIGSSSDNWLMTEFCLAGDVVKEINPDSDLFAICRIYKKPPKKRDVIPTTSTIFYQPEPQIVAAKPMTSPNYYQPQPQTYTAKAMMSHNDYKPQPQTVADNLMMSPNYYQPQPQTVTANPMTSANDYPPQAQTVTANRMTSPNYYEPQGQPVTANFPTKSHIDSNNLYSRLFYEDEAEKIGAIVDDLVFSGMNDDLDFSLLGEQLNWSDQYITYSRD